MITKTESSYPYSRIESDTIIQMRLSESLLDILPHGSGIDYDWHISHAKKNLNRFYASNGFHAMDESGMYCHRYDFTLTIDYIPESARRYDCPYCHNEFNVIPGYRSFDDMNRYGWSLQDFLNPPNDRSIKIVDLHGAKYWKCICNNGNMYKYPFELIWINWHGQREYACCGYGLKDYIYQTINENLSMVKGDSE